MGTRDVTKKIITRKPVKRVRGRRGKRGRPPIRAPTSSRIINKTDTMIKTVLKKLPPEVLKAITIEIYPAMEKEMKETMSQWRGAALSKGKSSVYNNFWYSRNTRMTGSTVQTTFKNKAIHAPSLVGGVNRRDEPWDVGDWVSRMAATGKLRNTVGLKNSKGKWTEVIMGIGETKRRRDTKLDSKISGLKRKLGDLQKSKKRYSGKKRDIRNLKKQVGSSKKAKDGIDRENMGRLHEKQNRRLAKRKFSALVKGKSTRDFWSPTVRRYFGNLTTSKSKNIKSQGSGEEAVKRISDRIYRELLQKIKVK